jgi:GT2 family glycosyltransferase
MTTHNNPKKCKEVLRELSVACGTAGLSGTVCLANSGVQVTDYDWSLPALEVLEFSTSQDTYWARGMRLAWEKSLEKIGTRDWVLWLNDDTLLDSTAISIMMKTVLEGGTSSIAVGACRGTSGSVSYGGFRSTGRFTPLSMDLLDEFPEVQTCDTFNGNLLLIKYETFRILGGFPRGYTHLRADIDFGFTAKKKGVQALVAAGTLATCELNENYEDFKDLKGLPLLARVKKINGPKFGPFSEHLRLCLRHGGWLGIVFGLAPLYRMLKAK